MTKTDAWAYGSGDKVKPEVVLGNDDLPTQESAREVETWNAMDLKAKADLILSISSSGL